MTGMQSLIDKHLAGKAMGAYAAWPLEPKSEGGAVSSVIAGAENGAGCGRVPMST